MYASFLLFLNNMERFADDVIGFVVNFVKKQKLLLLGLVGILLVVFRASVETFARAQISQLSSALSSGLSVEELASGLSCGVVSGLGPPGLTLAVALPVVLKIAGVLGVYCSAPALALAVAVNALMTVPDLLIWQAVFSRIGSKLLPGGRYIRPFLAGTVPWLLASPVMVIGAHFIAKTLLGTVFK
jgi:hypothetical protein